MHGHDTEGAAAGGRVTMALMASVLVGCLLGTLFANDGGSVPLLSAAAPASATVQQSISQPEQMMMGASAADSAVADGRTPPAPSANPPSITAAATPTHTPTMTRKNSEGDTTTQHTSPQQQSKEWWSCRDHPTRCAFLLQSFAMPSTGSAYVQRIAHYAAKGALPEDLWYALRSALQLREVYGSDSPIILATNYPTELLERVWRKALITNGAQLPFTEIVSTVATVDEVLASSSSSSSSSQFEYILKADAMRFADPQKYHRVMYIDTDTNIGDPSVQELLEASFNKNYEPTAAKRKKREDVSARAPMMPDDVELWLRRAAAGEDQRAPADDNRPPPPLPAKGSMQRRRLLLDAFDELNAFELAAVPEFGGHRDLSPGLYLVMLNMTESVLPYHPAKAWKKTPPAAYETQFNTGLVAFRNTECVVDGFVKLWSKLHRENQRCLDDRVAWDQCSFPLALRESRMRVAALPSVFNFREALGRGCSAVGYGPNYEHLHAPWRQANLEGAVKHVVVNHNQIKPDLLKDIMVRLLPSRELRELIECKPQPVAAGKSHCEVKAGL